jgi:ADP-ribose pyrophosphatase YjhB (NUDIX family)
VKEPRSGLTVRVGVIIVREGKILLVRHAKGGKSYWVLPGGKLERNEGLPECAAREVKEETGLDISVGSLLYCGEFTGSGFQVIDLFFRAKLERGEENLGYDPEDRGPEKVLKEMKWHPLEGIHTVRLLPETLKKAILRDWRSGFRRRGVYLGSSRT